MSADILLTRDESAWAERVAAALFLHSISPQLGMFDPAQFQKIVEAYQHLRSLPESWATELCLELLEVSYAPA